MLNDNDRKKYLVVSIVLIVALALLSLWNTGNKGSKYNPSNNDQVSSQTDLQASSKIMQQVVDEQQIHKDIEDQLKSPQQSSLLAIADASLNIQSNSEQGIKTYLENINSMVGSYNSKTEDTAKILFAAQTSTSQIQDAITETQSLLSSLYKLPVPRDAVVFHKAVINVYSAYLNLMSDAKIYHTSPSEDLWKNVYDRYTVINNASAVMNAQASLIKQKYSLQ